MSAAPTTGYVLVQSQLEIGFFDGISLREPTDLEYSGLMNETSRFYSESPPGTFSNLLRFDVVRVGDSFDAERDLPVMVQFDAYAYFDDGNGPVPTSQELYTAMEGLDYFSKHPIPVSCKTYLLHH